MQHKKRLSVAGQTVDARIYPHPGAPSVILIHGIGVSGEYFVDFADELKLRYEVHVLDLPGYGTTPKPKHVLSIVELVEVVDAYAQHSRLDTPILIGHSMGCQIAAVVARDNTQMYSRLILIGPTVDQKARSIFSQGMRLISDTFREPMWVNAIIFRNYLRMGPVRYLKTSRHMINNHIEKELLSCPVPTLIVRGERDPIASDRWVSELSQYPLNTRVETIPNASHAVHMTEAHELYRVCQRFIET